MRPAQRRLAAALPAAAAGMRMVSATVLVGTGTGTVVTPGHHLGIEHSDSFNRADGPLGGSLSDGGTADPEAWRTYAPRSPVIADHAVSFNMRTEPVFNWWDAPYWLAWLDSSSLWGISQATFLGCPENFTVGLMCPGGIALYVSHPDFWTAYSSGPPFAETPGYYYYAINSVGVGHGQPPVGGLVSPLPAAGDVLAISTKPPGHVDFLINGVVVATVDRATFGDMTSYVAFDKNGLAYYNGHGLTAHLEQFDDLATNPTPPLLGDYSFNPWIEGGTTTTPAGDASVDFGDGVSVPCPRRSICPALAVGDVVAVLRTGHSNVILDRITPLS